MILDQFFTTKNWSKIAKTTFFAISNFKNPLGDQSKHGEDLPCKIQSPTTFLLGCRRGPQIGVSFSFIKGQTVGVIKSPAEDKFKIRGAVFTSA